MKNLLFSLFLASIFITSCKKDSVETVATSDKEILFQAEVSNNSSNYQTSLNTREAYKGEVFSLSNLKRSTNIINIIAEGPCDSQGYTVLWDGAVNFNNSPTVSFVLAFKAKSTVQCAAIMKTSIELDLKKTLRSNYRENMIVNIYNATKKQDISIDQMGVVTKKN